MRTYLKVIGVKEVKASLRKIDAAINKGQNATLRKVLRAGKAYAQVRAPKDTGAMIRAIHFGTKGKGRGRQGWLVSEQPDHPRTGKTFAYHAFMHASPGAKRWRGDPQFMYSTMKWLETEFPRQTKNMVSAAIRGTGVAKTTI